MSSDVPWNNARLSACPLHNNICDSVFCNCRLLLLQRFENSVTDQLSQLEENSTNLNNINTQILVLRDATIMLLFYCCRTLNCVKSRRNERTDRCLGFVAVVSLFMNYYWSASPDTSTSWQTKKF